jgi:hypothetical protein
MFATWPLLLLLLTPSMTLSWGEEHSKQCTRWGRDGVKQGTSCLLLLARLCAEAAGLQHAGSYMLLLPCPYLCLAVCSAGL